MGWLLWSTQSPSGMLPGLLAGTWQQESAPRVTFVLQPSAFQGFAKPPYAWHCRACEAKGKKEFSLPSPPHREGQVPCQKATLHFLGMALKQAKPQSSSSARGKGNFLTSHRTRAHPGSTTQQSSSLPFAVGGSVLQAPFLSLSAGLGLGAGAAGEAPFLIQREAGRDFT